MLTLITDQLLWVKRQVDQLLRDDRAKIFTISIFSKGPARTSLPAGSRVSLYSGHEFDVEKVLSDRLCRNTARLLVAGTLMMHSTFLARLKVCSLHVD